MASKKQNFNFARIEAKRYGFLQEEIEKELNRLHSTGYEDIRQVFAGRDEIKRISSKECAHRSITVEFYFGRVENSPIDDYAVAQIREFLEFCKARVKHYTRRAETLGKEVNTD